MANRKVNHQETDESLYREVSGHLTDFSKHLMLILVASIAFSASMASTVQSDYSKLFLLSGVILSIFSFMFGHESVISKISSYLKVDKNFKPLPEKDRFNLVLIIKMKNKIEWQYWLTLAALLCICISIGFAVFDKSP